jgi:membrane fusion protein (multidrug efflux system)
MIIMLIAVGVILGGIFGYKGFQSSMMNKSLAVNAVPVVTVSAAEAVVKGWQPQISSVGSLRAVHGVDVTTEVAGLVQSVNFKSGDSVKAGQVLVQLNADTDIAELQTLIASRDLARSIYERSKKQFLVKAVSQASLDADEADLKVKEAEVAQQQAEVDKKTIRAPFAGRLGIGPVDPGQYLNPGDEIVTLQALDSLYVDFSLPQQELSRVTIGQVVVVSLDVAPDQEFAGRISAINSKVAPETRNVRIEAAIANPQHKLLPGMYATLKIQAGAVNRYLTIPRTAITFNSYGETVYVIESAEGADGTSSTIVKQIFVTVGSSRGDQVAILKGLKGGDMVVTSGQLKLKNGSHVTIDNTVQPLNDPDPAPVDK